MRSALGVDRMNALCPRRRSGQGLQPRPARWRAAPALTRALPWTTPNNHSLSDYSGATTHRPGGDIGHVWSSSLCMTNTGTVIFLRSSVKSVCEKATMPS